MDIWSLLMEVTFGPLYIISHVGIYLYIKNSGQSICNVFSLLFNALAGFSITLMLNVQKSVFSIGRLNGIDTLTEQQREMLSYSFKSGNLVQLGMDFCFDVFVSFGIVFFGLALLQQKRLIKWLGYLGILVGLLSLGLNMAVFPIPPADYNYPDPGPFFGGFFGLVLLNLIYRLYLKKGKEAYNQS